MAGIKKAENEDVVTSELNTLLKLHRLIQTLNTYADEIRRDERKHVWDEINKDIKYGSLRGNGCDETAQRNGLILATNIIFRLGI